MAYIPFPTGTILTFGGSVAPDGWLLCDGSTISRTTYARLFAVLSTTYGTGDGSTTFTLPDMRGIYPRGAGTNGTANYGGVTGHTPAGGVLANKGGQKTAKNGLANSSVSTPVSGAKNQWDGNAGWMSGNASHSHGVTGYGKGFSLNSGGSGADFHLPNWSYAGDAAALGTDARDVNHYHSIGWGGQIFSASGTTPAQTISGDTETTPAFLAVNYIIKL